MGNGSDSAQQDEYVSRFERRDRIERWLLRISLVLLALALGYFIYGIKVDFDKGAAILEACGQQATIECIEKAEKAFFQNR